MEAGTGLSRIQQISMRAHDMERAVGFYRDTLGVPFLFSAQHRIATLADREVWLADFEDTEGNTLALMSEPRLP